MANSGLLPGEKPYFGKLLGRPPTDDPSQSDDNYFKRNKRKDETLWPFCFIPLQKTNFPTEGPIVLLYDVRNQLLPGEKLCFKKRTPHNNYKFQRGGSDNNDLLRRKSECTDSNADHLFKRPSGIVYKPKCKRKEIDSNCGNQTKSIKKSSNSVKRKSCEPEQAILSSSQKSYGDKDNNNGNIIGNYESPIQKRRMEREDKENVEGSSDTSELSIRKNKQRNTKNVDNTFIKPKRVCRTKKEDMTFSGRLPDISTIIQESSRFFTSQLSTKKRQTRKTTKNETKKQLK